VIVKSVSFIAHAKLGGKAQQNGILTETKRQATGNFSLSDQNCRQLNGKIKLSRSKMNRTGDVLQRNVGKYSFVIGLDLSL
jgi:hypothetical protein